MTPGDLVFMGPPGSGKGTQAKKIAATYGVPHVVTGDMIREMKERPTELGAELREIYDRGDLVDDAMMIRLIRDRLDRGDTLPGFVLDGFPRNLAQAEALDVMLEEIDRPLSIILLLELDDDVARERLHRRAQVEGRADDTPEVIERRLATYHAETEPLAEYYLATGKLVKIHADRAIEDVFREIAESLDQVQARA
jgi:adenylate kinase